MKNLTSQITALIVTVLILSSCSALKVTFPSKNTEKVGPVALYATYFNIQKPVIPLLNAAITNERVNSISGELIPMFNENNNVFRESVAKSLKTQLNCEVIFGEALHQNPGYAESKKMYDFNFSLVKNDENFNEIIISKNDNNPFEFKKAKIRNYFTGDYDTNEKYYTSPIKNICKSLNIPNLAISVSTLMITAGDILTRDKGLLINEIYLFDKDGNCIAYGKNNSKLEPLKTDEVESYQMQLDKHSEIMLPVVEKIAVKYKN